MARGQQVEMLLAGLCDSSGNTLSAGKVYTYAAGTTTPASVYTDHTLSTPATNPVILDSTGKAAVFASGAFKFVIKTSGDSTLYTHDNLYYSQADSTHTTYSPTITAVDSMTITSITVTTARHAVIGPKTAFVELSFNGTIGGTPSDEIRVTLPFAATATALVTMPNYHYQTGDTVRVGLNQLDSASTSRISLFRPDFGNYSSGSAEFRLARTFEFA